jgi:hypothetical protein
MLIVKLQAVLLVTPRDNVLLEVAEFPAQATLSAHKQDVLQQELVQLQELDLSAQLLIHVRPDAESTLVPLLELEPYLQQMQLMWLQHLAL